MSDLRPAAGALAASTVLGAAGVLGTTGACSGIHGEAPILPRERALYTTLHFRPDGPELEEFGTRTLFRRQLRFAADGTLLEAGEGGGNRDGEGADEDDTTWLAVEFRGDRDDSGAFTAEIALHAPGEGWQAEFRLPPRTSGRWEQPLPENAGYASVLIELEPDPYYEMERMKPRGLPRAYGR